MSATIITIDEARAMLDAALKNFFALSETTPRKVIGQPKFVQYGSGELDDLTDHDFVHVGLFTPSQLMDSGVDMELRLNIGGGDTFFVKAYESTLSGTYIPGANVPVVFSAVKSFDKGTFTGFKFQLESI